jgi:DNA-binding transcriptional MocR family regulator
MATPILAEVGARWIREGTAERLVSWQRKEMMSFRNEMARKILGRFKITALASSLHAWLRLPEPWRADGFARQLRGGGVWVTPAEASAVGQGAAPQAVRISLGGATPSRSQLQQGLGILAKTLEAQPVTNFAIL